MKAGSALLEPELVHKRQVHGLQFTLECFEDFNVSLLREQSITVQLGEQSGQSGYFIESESSTEDICF